MRLYYFYSVIFGFFAGVFAAGSIQIPLAGFAAMAAASAAIAAFLFLYSKIKSKELAHLILIFCLFIFAFSLGGVRMNQKLSSFENDPLQNLVGEPVSLVGIAKDDASVADTSATIKIPSQSILLKYPNSEMKYGDEITFSGILTKPENFFTKQGEEFDYISYLKKDGIQYIISNPKIIEKIAGPVSLTSVLHSIKRKFISNIESVVPEPESALAAGVTVAGKAALPPDVKEDFIRSGVIHIVVLSGYNIAIVIGAMIAMFGFLGRRWASMIAILAVLAFVILSGGAAPVVRSALMAGIVLIGTLSYTPVIQNRALFGAALVMVFINPLLLISDASFALSFLATFAIINLVKIFEPRLSFISKRFQMRKILSETLATQIFVLPYLLYQIGRLSVIAPLSNIVILPFIPWLMLLCFIVGLIAFVPFIALPLAGLLFVLSWLVIWLAHFFASLPFASFDISISLWTMLLMYICYFAIGIYLNNKKGLTNTNVAKAV